MPYDPLASVFPGPSGRWPAPRFGNPPGLIQPSMPGAHPLQPSMPQPNTGARQPTQSAPVLAMDSRNPVGSTPAPTRRISVPQSLPAPSLSNALHQPIAPRAKTTLNPLQLKPSAVPPPVYRPPKATVAAPAVYQPISVLLQRKQRFADVGKHVSGPVRPRTTVPVSGGVQPVWGPRSPQWILPSTTARSTPTAGLLAQASPLAVVRVAPPKTKPQRDAGHRALTVQRMERSSFEQGVEDAYLAAWSGSWNDIHARAMNKIQRRGYQSYVGYEVKNNYTRYIWDLGYGVIVGMNVHYANGIKTVAGAAYVLTVDYPHDMPTPPEVVALAPVNQPNASTAHWSTYKLKYKG